MTNAPVLPAALYFDSTQFWVCFQQVNNVGFTIIPLEIEG